MNRLPKVLFRWRRDAGCAVTRAFWCGAGFGLLLMWGIAAAEIAWGQQAKPFRALSGYVVDEQFSALRREPTVKGPIIRRLRVGRLVAVLGPKRRADGMLFYRVAATRRTRGWIHERAFVMPARAGDDRRLLELIEQAQGFRRLQLAHIFVVHFERSPLRPRALLLLAEEAERAAQEVTARLRREFRELTPESPSARRQFYLNDESLDRYNRLGITFDYDEAGDRLVYDGWAYREILARHPRSAEALRARERLRP